MCAGDEGLHRDDLPHDRRGRRWRCRPDRVRAQLHIAHCCRRCEIDPELVPETVERKWGAGSENKWWLLRKRIEPNSICVCILCCQNTTKKPNPPTSPAGRRQTTRRHYAGSLPGTVRPVLGQSGREEPRSVSVWPAERWRLDDDDDNDPI